MKKYQVEYMKSHCAELVVEQYCSIEYVLLNMGKAYEYALPLHKHMNMGF